QRILSWYCQVDKFNFYLRDQTANGNDRSPEQERYEAAWQRATAMQNALVAQLRQNEHTVHTDGIIELNVPNLLRGQTALVDMATALPAAASS
ncbi:MAG: hypothetical protein ACE5FD_17740, partial [Anaerolineae bacterium]